MRDFFNPPPDSPRPRLWTGLVSMHLKIVKTIDRFMELVLHTYDNIHFKNCEKMLKDLCNLVLHTYDGIFELSET